MNGVYLALLRQDTPSPFLEEDDEVTVQTTEGTKEETSEEDTSVRIDIDGIADRIVKLPLSPSYYAHFYSDGNKVYYYTSGRRNHCRRSHHVC